MINSYADWAIIAVFVFIYGLIAKRLEQTWISGPMVFIAFGLFCGPFVLGFLNLNINSENLQLIVELTLALVLFTGAANANLAVLKSTVRLPSRLLLVGLPLTILLGFVVAKVLFPDFSLLEAGILSTMLAPTDADLGKAVVSNPDVPDNLREDLSAESGLNDGICVPILFSLLATATSQNNYNTTTQLLIHLFFEQIGIGVLVGATFAVVSTLIERFCLKRNWVSDSWQQVSVASIAIACFATTQILGGSGFIGCFVAGLIFGRAAKSYKQDPLEGSEATGDTLSIVTWVSFGAAVVGLALGEITWQIILYAILSLTIARIIPVFLCLSGTGLDTLSKLFVGWFGPRGLASIVFAVIVVNADLPASNHIATTAVCTITLSVIAHGLTANPLAKSYGKRYNQA